MALAYHIEGSTTFAAAGWSDATGFANSATLVVSKRFGPITAGLDQSGLSEGMESLHVVGDAVGDIGSASAYFMCDFDAAATSNFLYAPRGGSLWYRPKGDDNLCNLFEAAGNGTYTIGGGGTVTTLRHSRGIGTVGPDTIVTNLELSGPASATIEYNSTAITAATIMSGNILMKRVATTLNVDGGNVTIDATAGAITTLNIRGGNVTILSSGTITKINHYGGNLDLTKLKIGLIITNADLYPNVDRSQWYTGNPLITATNAPVFKGYVSQARPTQVFG